MLDALSAARDAGMDLVEVSPQETPPVCRIMDYGRYKYTQRKKQKKRVSHENILKEVRLRPKTDDHDRLIKMNRARTFIDSGHKVQFTMLFRGREHAHRDRALAAFNEIIAAFGDTVRVEREARMDGRRLTMIIAPIKH